MCIRDRAKGLHVQCGKASMLANGKSLIAQQDRGFIKLVYDVDNDCLVGAQLMCARATDMINELSTAIVNKLNKHQPVSYTHLRLRSARACSRRSLSSRPICAS